MKKVTTTNDINMVSIDDKFYWEILKERDGSDVYKIILGDFNKDVIICLYVKGTFSIKKFDDGDIFYFEMPFEKTSEIIEFLIKGHRLKFNPIYTIK